MIVGIGNDLVDSRRIEHTINRYGKRFIDRLFTAQEQSRVTQQFHQASGYAKLFAMKEAILKALGTGLTQGILWNDIEIHREINKPPTVKLSGRAEKILQKLTPNEHLACIHISVADEWPYAQAFAIISLIPN
jgi:holo-[acyl-carrier protein] synthase